MILGTQGLLMLVKSWTTWFDPTKEDTVAQISENLSTAETATENQMSIRAVKSSTFPYIGQMYGRGQHCADTQP